MPLSFGRHHLGSSSDEERPSALCEASLALRVPPFSVWGSGDESVSELGNGEAFSLHY